MNNGINICNNVLEHREKVEIICEATFFVPQFIASDGVHAA
jgi:hypothetical protein